MGYLIASLLFLHVKIRVQIGIAAALLLIFWGTMEFITVGNYGEVRAHRIVIWPNGSIAHRTGTFPDGATVENGR